MTELENNEILNEQTEDVQISENPNETAESVVEVKEIAEEPKKAAKTESTPKVKGEIKPIEDFNWELIGKKDETYSKTEARRARGPLQQHI